MTNLESKSENSQVRLVETQFLKRLILKRRSRNALSWNAYSETPFFLKRFILETGFPKPSTPPNQKLHPPFAETGLT